MQCTLFQDKIWIAHNLNSNRNCTPWTCRPCKGPFSPLACSFSSPYLWSAPPDGCHYQIWIIFDKYTLFLESTQVILMQSEPSWMSLLRAVSKMLSVKTVMQHLKKPPLLAHAFANFVVSCKNINYGSQKCLESPQYLECTRSRQKGTLLLDWQRTFSIGRR